MFWGVTLDSGKRYTQTVEKSFHLSMAALGFQNCSSTPVTVMVEVDKAQFALCTLQPGKIPQQPLDYCFTEGEEITFFTEGPGDVHLTGYLTDEPNALEFEDEEDELTADTDESESASVSNSESEGDESSSDEMTLGDLLQSGEVANDDNDDDDEEDESGDDDWDPAKDNPKKRKQTKKEKKKKKKSKSEDSEQHNGMFAIKDFDQIEGMQQSGDIGSEDDEDDYEPEKKVKSETKKETKQNKKKRKQQAKEQETVENGLSQPKKPKKKAKKSHLKLPDNDSGLENTESANSLENNNESENVSPAPVNSLNSIKKEQRKPQNQVEVQQASAGKKNNQLQTTETKKRKLPGGTVVEDITKGNGPIAKKGQKVHVYYKGNLAKNKKQFDACLNGPPFSFRLGAGEVIRGWDLGVAGMQVGGKRRLTVPPSQGYGKERMGPIPANSTLEFEIQLIRLQ
ncbi:hypothetical protein ACROYT_G000363 [Oculina patagonica]